MSTPFSQDIFQQPQDLRRLAAWYGADEGAARLARVPQEAAPLLTGMGASFHAALIAAAHFQQHRLAAHAVEATELLFYGQASLAASGAFIFVSQSGESAEIAPLAAQLPATASLFAVTNSPQSTIAGRADIVLPLVAEKELSPIASRTYINSLATLWLLVRRWAGVGTAGDVDAIEQVADLCEQRLSEAAAAVEQWLSVLGEAETLLFLGVGPGAASARHAAMMLAEWTKRSALSLSIGAFRHGPIEFARPGLGVVIFSAPGVVHTSVATLLAELNGYGVRALVVEQGRTFASPPELAADSSNERGVDPFLAPILDTLPAQLFVEAFARRHNIDTTFRHIGKVVTQI